MRLTKHQTLESILGLDKEIANTYQDETGFYIRLENEDYWYKLNLGEKLKAVEDPNGGYKFKVIE